jgi:DNA-directed RNA polymerase specialized sigma24 family protein
VEVLALDSEVVIQGLTRVARAQLRRSGVIAANRGHLDPAEALSESYLALRRRRNDGIIRGDAPAHYVARTAAGETRRLIRRQALRAKREVGLTREFESHEPAPLDRLIEQEEHELASYALGRIPPEDASLLRQHLGIGGQGLTFSQISRVSGVSPQAIHRRYQKALARCRSLAVPESFS